MATEKPEMQVIPARHGVATFVPAGQVIKIVNTSGTQVVDTWAFALPKPEPKKDQESEKKKEGEKKEVEKKGGEGKKGAENAKDSKPSEKPADEPEKTESEEAKKAKPEEQSEEKSQAKPQPARRKSKKGSSVNLPSQEEAEKATQEAIKADKAAEKDGKQANGAAQKSTWSSYVPSIGWSSKKTETKEKSQEEKDEQAQNSRTWASYFPSGKGFSSYIPKNASDTVSSFAATHNRDPSKSYLQQLQDFSKTPVGAAGLSALTGSGYGGTLYAGYAAWNAGQVPDTPAMEYMSMTHSRAMMLHMRPKLEDTLVSNLREPMLTLVEDSSPGIHDTLMAACDPQRYKGLGVEKWEEHGSCAENLVMALKELNERAGLKGAKAVGADVTINAVPAPLNLFMNIPWNDDGDLSFDGPKTKAGDYVRLKAERDVVVVMSACPQDILEINAKKPTDAHFVVEEESQQQALSSAAKKRVPQRRTASSQQVRRASSQAGSTASGKKPVPVRKPSGQPPKANKTDDSNATAGAPDKAAGEDAPNGDATPAPSPAKKAPAKLAPKANGTAATPKKAAPKPAASSTAARKESSADGAAAAAGAAGDANGTTTPKKKPRKLTPKAKPAAQEASS